jgi:hypothetical protein
MSLSITQAGDRTHLPQGNFNNKLPYITLICNGLLFLSYHRNGEASAFCEIGVHSQAAGHIPEIQVITISDDHLRSESIPFTSDLDLHVSSPPGGSESLQYYWDGTTFSHDRKANDPQDYRWLLDLESSLFYGPYLKPGERLRDPKVYKPSLRVYHGLFYTQRLTPGEYTVRNVTTGISTQPFAMPVSMAARISLSTDSGSHVRIGNRIITAPEMNQKKIILVQNECAGCQLPSKPDFNEYLRVIRRQSDWPELELTGARDSGADIAPCAQGGGDGGGDGGG